MPKTLRATQSPFLQQPEETASNNSWMKPLIIMLSISVGIVLIMLIWFLFFGGNKNKAVLKLIPQIMEVTPTPQVAVTISGIIAFEGYAPEEAYLVIVERTSPTGDFKSVVTGLTPQNGSIPWTWKDATNGSNYEIQAQLKIRGKTIQQSTSVSVSAPAETVTLDLISQQQPPIPQKTSISGNVHLDGYLPTGSTITVLSRPTGTGTYSPVITGLPAQNNSAWNWNNAMSGQTYDITVQLKNVSGAIISSDPDKTITAPASGLVFDISSTLHPPAPKTTGISGTVTINGSIASNSYVTLAQRKTGTSTFSQIGTIAAKDDSNWSWNSAITGIRYDLQAYLWVDGKPFASSNILTVTAPSTNNLMTINAQLVLAAPSANTINVTCNGQQNGNFQATITYNTNAALQNAQQYKVVISNATNGNTVVNTTLTPANPNTIQTLTTGYQFSSGTTYYVQYAYSNNNVFSSLSPSLQFSCR